MSSKKQKQLRRSEASAIQDQPEQPWHERHAMWIFVVLLALASIRIVSTYPVFNHTIDEPAHIACGMEWLDQGVYRYEPQHPPLARVAAALGPYFFGRRSEGRPDYYQEGTQILYRDGNYDRNLAAARLGMLPFFWIASLVVFLWARHAWSPAHGLAAAALFTFIPTVLAHAGLATTDMALTAFVAASFFTGILWAERPGWGRAVLFGVCVGAAVLSKLSSLPYIPLGLAAALAWHVYKDRPGLARLGRNAARLAPSFALAVAVGALTIWAGYRFSLNGVPAPELFDGIRAVRQHNVGGHPSYLLGMHSNNGFWYFYPVVLAVKTPVAFLLLLAVGCVAAVRRNGSGVGLPLVCALAIFAFGLTSRINIGLRHILPVYIGFSIVAAEGLLAMLRSTAFRHSRRAALALALWMAGTSIAAHPDYIPYFNLFAGGEPERIVADSDLDWGQDMKRLGERLRQAGAPMVTFNPFIMAYLEEVHGFPPIQSMDPEKPSPGWNAASLTVLKVARLGLENKRPELVLWPDRIPPKERVGKTTLLWYFPPDAVPQ